jgi:hypothetical protein
MGDNATYGAVQYIHVKQPVNMMRYRPGPYNGTQHCELHCMVFVLNPPYAAVGTAQGLCALASAVNMGMLQAEPVWCKEGV